MCTRRQPTSSSSLPRSSIPILNAHEYYVTYEPPWVSVMTFQEIPSSVFVLFDANERLPNVIFTMSSRHRTQHRSSRQSIHLHTSSQRRSLHTNGIARTIGSIHRPDGIYVMQRVEEEGEEQLIELQVMRPSVMELTVPPDPQNVKRESVYLPSSRRCWHCPILCWPLIQNMNYVVELS
jgi:hypothetical protein